MSDFSKSLFSLNGDEPALLPTRLRLPSGLTRYSISITLEELASLGYTGPFVLPELAPNQTAVWDSDAQAYGPPFEIEELADPEEECEDSRVRREIDYLLSQTPDLSNPDLTSDARNAYYVYYGTLASLKATKSLLTYEDMPVLELPQITSQSELDQAIDNAINTSIEESTPDWKYMYEVYGLEGWHEFPEIEARFVKPDFWVPSGTII